MLGVRQRNMYTDVAVVRRRLILTQSDEENVLYGSDCIMVSTKLMRAAFSVQRKREREREK